MTRKQWKAPPPPSWRATETLPPLEHWFVWPCGYVLRFVGCAAADASGGMPEGTTAIVTRCEAGTPPHTECPGLAGPQLVRNGKLLLP